MVDCLASLTRLEKLRIESLDWSNESRLRQHPPPLTRRTDSRLLPMLATLVFAGVGEYFDHLFTRIYAPRLEDIKTESHDPIIFDLLRIFLFTGLKETFEALDQVYMGKETSVLINVTLSSRRRTYPKVLRRVSHLLCESLSVKRQRNYYLHCEIFS